MWIIQLFYSWNTPYAQIIIWNSRIIFDLYLYRGIEEYYGMVGAVHIIQGTLGKAICGAAGIHHSQLSMDYYSVIICSTIPVCTVLHITAELRYSYAGLQYMCMQEVILLHLSQWWNYCAKNTIRLITLTLCLLQ